MAELRPQRPAELPHFRVFLVQLIQDEGATVAHIGENGEDEWQDFLKSEGPTPEDVVIGMKDSQTRSQWLQEALSDLSERERVIINRRHLGYETVTLEELGKDLGVSKERVRQLEQRAMDKLKTSLSRHAKHAEAIF